jgi:hypothetical protein
LYFSNSSFCRNSSSFAYKNDETTGIKLNKTHTFGVVNILYQGCIQVEGTTIGGIISGCPHLVLPPKDTRQLWSFFRRKQTYSIDFLIDMNNKYYLCPEISEVGSFKFACI